jgi:phage-related tail protein
MMTAYNEIDSLMKNIDKQLDDIFGVAEKTTTTVQKTEESVSSFQRAINSFKDSIADLGGDVAGNFISSLNSGLDLDSALISFKKFIRNYVVQASVYTESLKDEFSKIGLRVWHYVSGSYPKSELDNIKKSVSSIYGNLAESLKGVDEVLDEIFGKEKEEEIKDSSSTITKELSKIESAMKSFKETVSDLGGDIASNLVDGLANGLNQSDFLKNMKDWIKKMLVQSVVYTETMKSEIEAIGKRISEGITTGFSDTSLHEIRRDLSYIFESASSKMSGIDSLLGSVFSGYASGTESATRGLHIVGEAGPELVRFRGGERVYNNRETKAMMSGSKTNNFNVTFNNMLDTSAFAMMNQLKRYNKEMAINGVI